MIAIQMKDQMHLYSSFASTVVNKVIISRTIKQTRETFMFTHLLSEKIKDAHLAWEDINGWRHGCKCSVNKNRKRKENLGRDKNKQCCLEVVLVGSGVWKLEIMWSK